MMATPKQDAENKKDLTAAHYDHAKGLALYAYFKVHNKTLSADLVQDTYIKTWSYLVRGGKIETMKAFLYHTLNNLIVDEYRKKKTSSLDTLLEKGFDPKGDDPERLFNILDGKAALILIKRLPMAYQKVMRMRYIQDMTLTEMSLITGQTKNALAVQVHRGLAKLRSIYNFKRNT